jgi:hypothetical protein
VQGGFSKGVRERICRENNGLFPSPKEIQFSCSCPDWAYLCKHVAAVLYGIGARLDRQPCFDFTSWTKRNSSAAPVESFLSQRKEEIPKRFCLPAIFLNSSDWISLKPPHCLQLAQVGRRVRRKCEGAGRSPVPAGDSGRHKPSAAVFSLFSWLLLACTEQLAQEVLATRRQTLCALVLLGGCPTLISIPGAWSLLGLEVDC